MSGTLAALTAQQLVTTGFQAWQPWVPLPDNPPGPPNFLYGVQPQTSSGTPPWLSTVLASWITIDPLPTIPPQDVTNIGAGAALKIQGNARVLWQATILAAWQPPDPLPTLPAQLGKFVTKSGPPTPPVPTPGGLVTPPQHVSAYGAVPTYSVPAVGASALVGGIVPAAALTSVVAIGGIAVAVVQGPLNGGYVTNPANASAQGVTAENLYIDLVNEPGSTDATANGTTVLLVPGQSFTIPAIAAGVTVWANATTSGHKFTVTVW